MQALRDIAPYLALAACVVAIALAAFLTAAWRRLRKLRRSQTVVLGHHEERDLVAHAEHLEGRVQNLREAVEILTGTLDTHKLHLDEALTNRAVVRYDAFRDAGGEQSASIALLDNYGSGLVISTISARDFARLYVKLLDRGVPDRELSPEEARCVALAVPKHLAGAGTMGTPVETRAHGAVPAAEVPPVVGTFVDTAAGDLPAESTPARGDGPAPAPDDVAAPAPDTPAPGDATLTPPPRPSRERTYQSWFDADDDLPGGPAGDVPGESEHDSSNER